MHGLVEGGGGGEKTVPGRDGSAALLALDQRVLLLVVV